LRLLRIADRSVSDVSGSSAALDALR